MKHLLKQLCILLMLILLVLPVQAKQKNTVFAQVTDLHFDASENSISNYKNLIHSINNDKQIKFVVFTGDNIDKPSPDLLKVFLKIANRIKVPYYIQIGDSECFKSVGLSKKEYMKYVNRYSSQHLKSFNYVVKKDNIIFIFVDGTKEVIPSPNGYYKDETLNWLDKMLTKYEKENVIIVQHYPLSDVSENSLQNLYKPQSYKDVIAKHKNIVAVFAGHYHINREELIDNVMYLTTDAARGGTYRKIFLTPVENNKIEVYSQNINF